MVSVQVLSLYGRRIIRPRGLLLLGHHPLTLVVLALVVVAVVVWQQHRR